MASTPAATRQLTPTKPLSAERAQETLEALIKARGIPGAGFAASQDGELIVNVAAGVANVDTGLAATDATIWQPGSIGKTYTAVLVMQLVDEGRLDLDQPVVSYLPDVRFADEHATRTITVRQLLCHTGGIDGDRIDETGALFGRGDDAVTRYVDSLADLAQIVEPGRLWSYCNAGYVVLGRIVEVLRGMTFERALREHLLQPAGLNNTFSFAEEVIQRNAAAGHMPGPDGMMISPIWMPGRSLGPAGTAVLATMADLLAFADILLRRGLARDGTRILSETSVSAMETPHAECPERELLGGHWGLGLLIKLGPPAVYGHDGNTFGQTAALRYVPEHNLAFGLITNRLQANKAFAELSSALVDAWAGTVTERQRTPVAGFALRSPERFLGTFENIAAAIKVHEHDGELAVTFDVKRDANAGLDNRPRVIQPLDDATFVVHLDEVDDDLQLAFLEPDAGGKPTYLHFGARIYKRTA